MDAVSREVLRSIGCDFVVGCRELLTAAPVIVQLTVAAALVLALASSPIPTWSGIPELPTATAGVVLCPEGNVICTGLTVYA
jgi:hypothetical protein